MPEHKKKGVTSKSKEQSKKPTKQTKNDQAVSELSSSDDDLSKEADKELKEMSRRQQLDEMAEQLTPMMPREQLLATYRALSLERNQLQMKNNILHRRMAEFYRKRKQEHVLKPIDLTPDVEERYNQQLVLYQEVKDQQNKEIELINSGVHVVELEYEERLKEVEAQFEQLQSLERTTGTGLIYSSKGKNMADKTVERYLFLQKRKREQASALCLRYIRARNAVAELDAIVRKLEMVGPGLYVAEYEQLYVDKQNYLNKIEEREDELIRNRTKCTEHNQILAHIREKMSHTDEVIEFTECDLGDAQMMYFEAREELNMAKTRRDKLRWYLEDEKIKAGLLTKKELLYDFQNAIDELVQLKDKKRNLELNILKMSAQLERIREQMAAERLSRIESEKDNDDLSDQLL